MGTYYAKTAASGSGTGADAANAMAIDTAVAQVNSDGVAGLIYICADATYNSGSAYTKLTQHCALIGANSAGVVDGTRPVFTCNYDADYWFLGSSSKCVFFVNVVITGGSYPARRPLLYSGPYRFLGCRFYNFSAGIMGIGNGFAFDALCEYDTVTASYGIANGRTSLLSYYVNSGPLSCGNITDNLLLCLIKNGRKGARSGIITDQGYGGGGLTLFSTVVETPDSSAAGIYASSGLPSLVVASIISGMTGVGINNAGGLSASLSVANVLSDNDGGDVSGITQIGDSSAAASYADASGTPPDYSPDSAAAIQEGWVDKIACPFEIFGVTSLNAGCVLGPYISAGGGGGGGLALGRLISGGV